MYEKYVNRMEKYCNHKKIKLRFLSSIMFGTNLNTLIGLDKSKPKKQMGKYLEYITKFEKRKFIKITKINFRLQVMKITCNLLPLLIIV